MENAPQLSNSNSVISLILKILLNDPSAFLNLVFDIFQRLPVFKTLPGMYEVLDYETTLELKDSKGKVAVYTKRQRVRFLQNNVIAFYDTAWGDGEIFGDYKCSPGYVVDRFRDGYRYNILISLRETKHRGDKSTFHIQRMITNGFTQPEEAFQTDINHRTRKLTKHIIFPKSHLPKEISITLQNGHKTIPLTEAHSCPTTLDLTLDDLYLEFESVAQNNVIVVDDTSGGQLQSMQSFGIGTFGGGEQGNEYDGLCRIHEAIEKANYLSENPGANPALEPFSDCAPSSFDGILPTGSIGVDLLPATYVFSDANLLPTINGNVIIRKCPESQERLICSTGEFTTIERYENADDFRIFNIEGGELTLENIIVRNGRANNGGGIFNAGILTLRNSAVIGNYASVNGGGIYNTGTGTLTIENSVIQNNTSGGEGDGGGIYNSGTLNLQNSSVSDNHAEGGGSGIYNSNTVIMQNSVVDGNYASGDGGIWNSGELTLINSTIIGNYATGNGAGIYNTGTGTLNISNSIIQNNIANANGGAIYHESSGTAILTGTCITGNFGKLNWSSIFTSTTMTALNNWWGATSGPSVNTLGTGDAILGNVQWQSQNSDPQTASGTPCNTNRPVPTEAQAFHDRWQSYGLPIPFNIFPYEDTSLRELSVQGYGPNTFAYENWANNYKGTYAIHPGVDYARWRACEGGDNQWCQARIVSLCDGVVTRGRNPNDGYGGSASPGYGISIRCFDNSGGSTSPNEPINLLDYDTDGDGNPNLSNIIITYNHLGYCTNWDNSECTGDRINTRFSDYYTDTAGVGVVVRQGQFLGTTGYHPTFDHLHMEVYLARGYESASSAIVLNPFLMYSNSLWDLHAQQGHLIRAYYPVRLDFTNLDPVANVYEGPSSVGDLGIFVGDLNRWSQGGNRARGNRTQSDTWFWRIQEVEPTTVVEWHPDLYPIPLGGVGNDDFSTDLSTYISNIYPDGTTYADRYLQEFGKTPNCVVVPDTTPIRVQCPRDDLTQDLP